MSIFDFLFFIINNTQVPNRKFWIFFPFYIFTLILSTIKKKMKLSGNVAFPTILQSVAWLSNSVFGRSLKIENWPGQLPCLRDWEGSESLIVSS